jgi:hypothetical protein
MDHSLSDVAYRGALDGRPRVRRSTDDVAHGRTDAILDGSTYLAKIFNETTIDSARDFLFHHPDDAHLVPEQLPPPRPMQLEWSPGPPE